MMNFTKASFLITSLSILSACSSQGAYNAMKSNQCLEKTGRIQCNDIEDYETYKHKRDELLKKNP
ncbi:hypothetical protein NBRC116188_23360 [Oceaniserpentilla sp. 4NH20-0058]